MSGGVPAKDGVDRQAVCVTDSNAAASKRIIDFFMFICIFPFSRQLT